MTDNTPEIRTVAQTLTGDAAFRRMMHRCLKGQTSLDAAAAKVLQRLHDQGITHTLHGEEYTAENIARAYWDLPSEER